MSRKIAHIFLWIPLVVVLLHSFVPHHHYSDDLTVSISAEHECPDSLLSDLFEFDLGSHHLEEYNISRNEHGFLLPLILTEYTEFDLENRPFFVSSFFTHREVVFDEQFQCRPKSLRAPPPLLLS